MRVCVHLCPCVFVCVYKRVCARVCVCVFACVLAFLSVFSARYQKVFMFAIVTSEIGMPKCHLFWWVVALFFTFVFETLVRVYMISATCILFSVSE